MYAREWVTNDLSLDDLDGNKKVTAVYRLMRLFGFYALYQQRSAGIPSHRMRGRLRFYMENKIDPIFASGRMFPEPLMLRATSVTRLGLSTLVILLRHFAMPC